RTIADCGGGLPDNRHGQFVKDGCAMAIYRGCPPSITRGHFLVTY
ncbi:hypothetical protein A2U01_0079772, partial [Trifolium medium]|nr:hypothetical protein [Trifolium medium]